MSTNREKIISYLQHQIAQSDTRVRHYALDEHGQKNPTRNAFVKVVIDT